MTGRQLGAGLIACRDSGEGWPPTLPEFRAMCLGDNGLIAADKAAHRIYEPERLIENTTSTDRRSRLAEVMGLLS